VTENVANAPSGPGAAAGKEKEQPGSITPELLAKVTEKVYAMLLADLKLDRERRGSPANHTSHFSGGW